MTSGRYVAQKRLDEQGNLNTQALRDAKRNEGDAVTGIASVVVNARIPSQSETLHNGMWREERQFLGLISQTPTGEAQSFTVDAATDIFTAANHNYASGGQVRVQVTGGSLPAPLAAATTYFVRDVSTNTFKLAATSGGAAINITTAGSGTLEVYGYTTVTARFRGSGSLTGLSSAPWQTDATLVPDYEWLEIEATLTGDGYISPIVPPGGAHVFYKCFQPVLLRSDRSPLAGGIYIGGGSDVNLRRPYRRSLFDTDAVGDRAAPRSITARVGRIDGFPFHVFHADALDEILSDDFLKNDWYIESPYHNMVMRVRFYEPPSEPVNMDTFEYPHLDEGGPLPYQAPQTLDVERAELLEADDLL